MAFTALTLPARGNSLRLRTGLDFHLFDSKHTYAHWWVTSGSLSPGARHTEEGIEGADRFISILGSISRVRRQRWALEEWTDGGGIFGVFVSVIIVILAGSPGRRWTSRGTAWEVDFIWATAAG